MTLFSDFLRELGVPHTEAYSDSRFAAMPFRSLFGLSKLLQDYGVAAQGLRLASTADFAQVPVPYVAATPRGMVIVTRVADGQVDYLSRGVAETMALEAFEQAATGTVLVARADRTSREPDYGAHRRMEFFTKAKRWVLWGLTIFVLVALFVSNGVWRYPSLIAVTAFDLVGLFFCTLLMGKTLNIHSAAADAVCGAVEKGGCDDVLATKASSFFGLFKWSELGFAYFGVSLVALLAFPKAAEWLAWIGVCCLPFTVWSVSYQKFVIKHWCTMCLGVQTTLWALFFSWLAGGWLGHSPFPLALGFWVLTAVYGIALLTINRLTPYLTRHDTADS